MRRAASIALVLLLATGAPAHWPTAEEVIAEIGGPAGSALGVVTVARDARVARVLLVRVGGPWYALAPERRRALADEWRAHWREAVPDGVVGVVDATSERPLVNYDALGQAHLAPPTPP